MLSRNRRETAIISSSCRPSRRRDESAFVQRRVLVDERERDELRDCAGSVLQVTDALQVQRTVVSFSTWPYIIVEVTSRPTDAAAAIASSHSSVRIFPGQITSRTSSTRISAAVPGTLSRPASCSRLNTSS